MDRNEALEILRKSHDKFMFAERAALETLIPELAESEDERIRKWIKKEIEDKYVVEGIVNNKLADEAFGWLEKQKHLYETTKDRFYREGFEEGQLYERQKEQKPNLVPKIIRPKFAVGDTVCRNMWPDHTIQEIYIDCYDPTYICINEEGIESHISFSEQDEWERKEQKPAEWSEKDEKMRIKTTLSLQYLIEEFPNADFINSVKKEKEWLKTLPLNLKKRNEDVEKLCSNEWSEEDEKMLHGIEQCVYDNVANIGTVNKVKYVDFLSSLRPSWKPSEEQMEALNTVLEHEAERVGSSKELEKANALYEQLKKRM